MNYFPTLLKLPSSQKHPNADRLLIFKVGGFSVITDTTYNEGDLVFYFPIESAINPFLCRALNLYANTSLNNDKDKKGYLQNNARVRAISLRGAPSEGLVLKYEVVVNALKYKGKQPNLGEVEKLGDYVLSTKYEPPAKPIRQQSRGVKHKAPHVVPGQYILQPDVPNPLKANWLYRPGITSVSITEKLHGSNGSIGKPLVYRKLNWLEKLKKFFGFKVQLTERKMVYASKRVIKTDTSSSWYGEDIWREVFEPWLSQPDKWPDGLQLFGEVVGKTKSGKWVQKNYDYKKLLDREYPGKTLGFFVFRAIKVEEDGQVIELPLYELQTFFTAMGIKRVPTLGYRTLNGQGEVEEFISNTRALYSGKCIYCENDVPREGVVVKRDSAEDNVFEVCKIKSEEFLRKETEDLDKGEDVNE